MSYLDERVYKGMGVSPEQCTIKLKNRHGGLVDCPIFESDRDDNIKIRVYDLDRLAVTYDHPLSDMEHNTSYNQKEQSFFLTRNNPKAVEEGKPRYVMPKGAGIYPFLPPALVDKYDRKEHIKTLVLTEGFFKAFKASLHGWDIVGLSSITHYANSKTKTLHKDIVRLIIDLKVENVVMLYDGDCLNIDTKCIEAKEDLANRPNIFLNTMLHIKELLTDYNVNVYFSHVLSDNIVPNHPKGLDDLLIDQKGKEQEILDDMMNLAIPGKYFYRLNVSTFARKLQSYFNLKNAEQFYSAWMDIIKDREFIYFGSTYKVNSEGKLERTVPRELKAFIRVGDNYYETIKTPNIVTGELHDKLVPRKKTTITDDFGKNSIQLIPKYKSFINMPNNINYQRIVANCYNIYNPFEFQPEAGDWRHIENFLKHIFEEHFELGLDYLQILYQHPTQALPILCLVSRERKTGKTTFLDFLLDIFGENAIKLGSQEMQNQFNSYLAMKLLVGVDETSLDKNRDITERLKMLSTTKKVISNGKGTNQEEVDHFAKYILCSNFETNFIYTQEDETRFWVRKVKPLEKEEPNLLALMHDEIPAFLYFLNCRKTSVPCTTRTWFDEKLLVTDALIKLKDEQRSTAEKMIREYVHDIMLETKTDTLMIDNARLIDAMPALKRYEDRLNKVIKENLKTDKYMENGICKTKRFKVPRFGTGFDGDIIVETDSFIGKPWVFKSENFLTEKEIQYIKQ